MHLNTAHQKEYIVNKEERHESIKNGHKRGPEWEKEKRARRKLFFIPLAIQVVVLGLLSLNPFLSGDKNMLSIFLSLNLAFAIIPITIWIYRTKTHFTYGWLFGTRAREALILNSLGIRHSYHPFGNDGHSSAVVVEVQYSDIQNIEFDECYNRLAITCSYTETKYHNYYKISRKESSKTVGVYFLYLHFYEKEDLINRIMTSARNPISALAEVKGNPCVLRLETSDSHEDSGISAATNATKAKPIILLFMLLLASLTGRSGPSALTISHGIDASADKSNHYVGLRDILSSITINGTDLIINYGLSVAHPFFNALQVSLYDVVGVTYSKADKRMDVSTRDGKCVRVLFVDENGLHCTEWLTNAYRLHQTAAPISQLQSM